MASYGHPEATPEWLLMGRLNNPLACFTWHSFFMGVQACRLPALKPTLQTPPSKPLKRSKPLRLKNSKTLTQPTATPMPHIHGFLWPPRGHTA